MTNVFNLILHFALLNKAILFVIEVSNSFLSVFFTLKNRAEFKLKNFMGI